MRRMNAAEIEVGNEHRNRMAQIFQLLAVSNRATGEPARKCANTQIRALGAASCVEKLQFLCVARQPLAGGRII